MTAKFVHLRTHSTFSLLESTIFIDDLVDLAVKNNMPAVALTDSGNLFALLEFSQNASKKGIQPIIGCEMKFLDSEQKNIYRINEPKLDKIVLLAQDQTGYKNLLYIVSDSFIDSDSNLAVHTDMSKLKEFNQGLIVLLSLIHI